MLHLLGDLQVESKQGFGVSFSLSISTTFIRQLKTFYHFRIKKWILQPDRIRLAFLCFPISLHSVPPQSGFNSLSSLISSFALNSSSSSLHLFVLLFFYAQAPPSTPACFLSHIAFPYLPCPLCSPHLLLLLWDKVMPENVFLCRGRRQQAKEDWWPWRVFAAVAPAHLLAGAEGPSTINLYSLFILKIFLGGEGVIVGGINSLRNICCHVILE